MILDSPKLYYKPEELNFDANSPDIVSLTFFNKDFIKKITEHDVTINSGNVYRVVYNKFYFRNANVDAVYVMSGAKELFNKIYLGITKDKQRTYI